MSYLAIVCLFVLSLSSVLSATDDMCTKVMVSANGMLDSGPIDRYQTPGLLMSGEQQNLRRCRLLFVNRLSQPECKLNAFSVTNRCVVVFVQESCSQFVDPAIVVRDAMSLGGSAVIFSVLNVNLGQFIVDQISELRSLNTSVIVVKKEDDNIGSDFRHDTGVSVNISIGRPREEPCYRPSGPSPGGTSLNRSTTTFYFVVFAFIILLLLSLTWFVFNYCRRCRHAYTSRRRRAEMLSTVTKAINKCPTKLYRRAKTTAVAPKEKGRDETDYDYEEEDSCPICLEIYKPKDLLRVLPCKHEFHKSCVDPWLMEKDTCPLCKSSIIKKEEEIAQDGGVGGSTHGLVEVAPTSAAEQGRIQHHSEVWSVESIEVLP